MSLLMRKRGLDSIGLRRPTRRVALAIGALVVAAGLAVGPQGAYADSKPLVIARDMDLNSLDPSRAYCDTCQIYMNAVYETLLTIAPDNHTLTPVLAQSWESNADQTQFTFHLDPKAVFSDGSPVEAKDVKWTFERLANMKASASYFMDGVKSIEAPDAHTVVITMAAPNSEFIGIMAAPNTGIINSKAAIAQGALANADAATKDPSEPWFLANSAGSGPYMLDSYKPNDELRLKVNDKYWRAKPAIDAVVLRQVKESVAQAQMLENGGADIAMQVDPDTAKTINSPDVTVSMAPSYNFLYFAVSPGAKDAPVQLTKEVRQAMGYAVDYQGAIDLTLSGNGKLQASPIPNGFPGAAGLALPVHDRGEGQGASGQGRACRWLHHQRSLSEHDDLWRRHEHADAEGAAGSGQGEYQGRAAAPDLHGLARAGARRRHSADGRVLRAGLFRLGAICAVFRHGPWRALGQAGRGRESAGSL